MKFQKPGTSCCLPLLLWMAW